MQGREGHKYFKHKVTKWAASKNGNNKLWDMDMLAQTENWNS